MGVEVIGTAEYRITADTTELESGIKKAKNIIEDGTESIAENAEKGTKSVGKLSTVTTALISSVVAKAVDAGSNAINSFVGGIYDAGVGFESTMSRVAAISGATGADFDALSQKAKELGLNTRYSANEVAEGFTYMSMAGWGAADMLDGIEGLLNLATVGALDLGTTSDIVTDQLTAFGMSAADAGKMADVMAKTITSSNTDVSMMGETLKYVGAVAGSLGYDFEDVSVAIGLMANASIKGSQAGTSLRSIMSRLANDTNGCATALADMGVEVVNTDGSMRDFGDVLVDMRGAFANLSEAEKTQLASTIAGTEGMAGLLAIVNASTADFDGLTSSIANSTGAAEDMAGVIGNNVDGNLKGLQSRIQSLQQGAFEALKPSINSAISGLSDLSSAFASAFSGGDNVSELVSGFVSKFGTALKQALPQLGKTIAVVVPILLQAVVGLLPDLLAGLMNAITILFNDLADALPDLITVLVDALMGIVDVLLSPELYNSLLEGAFKMWHAIVEAIPQLIAALANAIPQIINSIFNLLTNPQTLNTILNGAVTMFTASITAIPIVVKSLADALPDIITSIVNFLTSPDTIGAIFNAAATLFFALVDAVPTILGSLLDAFGALVGGLWNGILAMFGTFASNFGAFIGGAFKVALNGVLGFIEGFINTPINLINGFIDVINGAFGAIGVNIGKLGGISLPRMYTGGIVPANGQGTPIIAGDGGEDEFVVPESKMASLMRQLQEDGDIGGQTFNFTFNGVLGTPSEMRELAIQFHDKYEEVKKSRFQNA